MALRTTLFAVPRKEAVALLEDGDLGFNGEDTLELDKAGPVLSRLIGSDPGMRPLHYPDALEIADAGFRGFLPEDVVMFLRRVREAPLEVRLNKSAWETDITGQVYPFEFLDSKEEARAYILEHGAALEGFLDRAADRRTGMISVET